MFGCCANVAGIDLSDFDTSNVTTIWSMFCYCTSLTSLDLFNFDTSQVTFMYRMFYQCINLEYINIYKFTEINLNTCNDIFVGVPENIVICIDENNIKDKIYHKYQI